MLNVWHFPFNMLIILIFAFLAALPILSSGEPYGGSGNGGVSGYGPYGLYNEFKCPRSCSCVAQTVDCSHRGLQQVPRKIPVEAERL